MKNTAGKGLVLFAMIATVGVAYGADCQSPDPRPGHRYRPFLYQVSGRPLPEVIEGLGNADSWKRYLGAYGAQNVTINPVTGRATHAGGPFIPLITEDQPLDDETIEVALRSFLAKNADIFRIPKAAVLHADGRGAVFNGLGVGLVRFDLRYAGLAVPNAGVAFVLVRRSLAGWSSEGLNDSELNLRPSIAEESVPDLVLEYLKRVALAPPRAVEKPRLIAFSERASDSEFYRLVWEMRTRQPNYTLLIHIDAQSGAIIECLSETACK